MVFLLPFQFFISSVIHKTDNLVLFVFAVCVLSPLSDECVIVCLRRFLPLGNFVLLLVMDVLVLMLLTNVCV